MIRVSAPGKVILMGEHAVVYGKPALISAVDMRLTATVSESDKLEIIAEEGEAYIKHILGVVCSHFNIGQIPSLKIEIHSDIPIGYHLGSSAAVAVALVGALSYYIKRIWNPTLINQLAYESEKFVHNNASGVDPAAIVSGSLIWYRKELDFLRSIWQFPFQVPTHLSHFCLIDTGRPKESTGEMVDYVRTQNTEHKSQFSKLFNENEEQVKRITAALKEGKEEELLDAIKTGERTLEGMGVVSKKVVPLIRSIEKAGGAAKILGGGGKADGVGFLLCYHHDPKKIASLSSSFGFSIRHITLGEEGVRLEEK